MRLAALLLALGLTASACGGDGAQCGAADAPSEGVTVAAGAGANVTFGQFLSSPNNDCPPPEGSGPTSLTVQGEQTDPAAANRFLVLCLPRPDLIGSEPIPLSDAELVRVIDIIATDTDGCRLELDRDLPLAGDVTFSGFCDDGTHPDGYAISFSATVPLLRTCPAGSGPGEPAPIDGDLAGRAAVTAAAGLQASVRP